MAAVNFVISNDGPPQTSRTRWYATETASNEKFLVGYSIPFKDGDGPHRGLSQTRVMKEIPALYFDRALMAATFGLWAHFIWPSVVAESGGHHLLVNTYDRARFTFGFYQLAAHTPNDNLILLFRRLLELPKASHYFPDLTLKNGKVHLLGASGTTTSLEVVTSVTRPNGKVDQQIVGFMAYLNPDTQNVGEIEVLNTAKLMHWLVNDTHAVATSLEVALGIMRRKLARLAKSYSLIGRRPELVIWVSDITHQGRGKAAEIRAALAAPSLSSQLAALELIGKENPDYDGRRATVSKCIKVLIQENRFGEHTIGNGELTLGGV